MRISPKQKDLENWAQIFPNKGDLVFLAQKDLSLVENLQFPIYSQQMVRDQSLTLWTLNSRSWYGYALNSVPYCVWFPSGEIESLDIKLRTQLAKTQIQLQVPTLLNSQRIPQVIKKKCILVSGHIWLTSSGWNNLSRTQKRLMVSKWFVQNGVNKYSSVSFRNLPSDLGYELSRLGFKSLLNQFSDESGPNCFACVAAAISQKSNAKLARQWMHWAPLSLYLNQRGFKKVRSQRPEVGDVLVFIRAGTPIHAAYYLGQNLYFEKPGQDFYEPYRIEDFGRWQQEWPGANLQIWRKK